MAENADPIASVSAASAGRDGAVIGLVCTAHFFSHFYIFAIPPMLPLIKADLEVSYTEMGLLITLFSLSSGAAQYFMGVLVDRVGARRVLAGGMALLATAIAMMGVVPIYGALAVFALAAGLGNSVFHPADYTILSARVRPGRVGRAFSLHTFSGMAGFATAPLAMTFLATAWDWRTAFVTVGVAGLATVVVLLSQMHLLDEGQSTGSALAKTSANFGLHTVLSPPILFMFIFFFVVAMVTLGMSGFMPAALKTRFGMSLVDANLVLTGFLAASGVGVLFGGFVADRLQRLDIIASVGFAAAAAVLMLVALTRLPYPAILAVFLFAGFMVGMISPSRDMMVRNVSPPGASGRVFGFVSIGLDVGGVAAPVFFGWLMDRGQPEGVFIGAAAVLLLAILAGFGANRYAPCPAATK
ncbi:MAG: MFS transporter [Rhodospirillaceae bacterium]|nr:MFS transporter [Rhodospirillaceae bacterium]